MLFKYLYVYSKKTHVKTGQQDEQLFHERKYY